MKQIKAIYPGSFDPLTNGHLDLIERGSKIFHELVVAILRNAEKEPLFGIAERREMLAEATSRWPNVKVDTRLTPFQDCWSTMSCSKKRRPSCVEFAPSATTSTSCKWH